MARLVMAVYYQDFSEEGKYVDSVIESVMTEMGLSREEAVEEINANIGDYFDYRISDWHSDVEWNAWVDDVE